MLRPLYSPSTLRVEPQPDPLLLFIRQAQLVLLYGEESVDGSPSGISPTQVSK